MADVNEIVVTCIIFIYQGYLIIRSIHPIKKDALQLILHNVLLYYVINMFKHTAQAAIESPGPVNTFYYVPFVYEEPAGSDANHTWHQVLKSSSWQFFEAVFRHHLALLLPFILAIMVPRCKLTYIFSLVVFSNLLMIGCFASAICQLLISSGHDHGLRLLTIMLLGPIYQLFLVLRMLARIWFSIWIVV